MSKRKGYFVFLNGKLIAGPFNSRSIAAVHVWYVDRLKNDGIRIRQKSLPFGDQSTL